MKTIQVPGVLLLLALFLPAFAQEPSGQAAATEVVAAELGATRNVHRAGDLWFSGQFGAEDVALIAEQGLVRVITLRTDGEVSWDEAAELDAAELEFLAVPFRAPDTLTDEVFDKLRELLRDEAGPTLLHCGSANRVGGAWLPYRVLDQGVALEQALAEAETIGLRTPGYRERAIAYIERHQAGGIGREKSVKEGINKPFKDPELDVEAFVKRFEIESREVYSARREILAAMKIEAGMRVADVGAGTGLYTFPLSAAVGPKGWVYAIDIAPRFLERIRGIASDRRVENLTGVLCAEDSIGLPPESIDLAFVCDTYHHFEYPQATTRSILRALKPGGRLVLVEFDRIPGVSRDWILGHVRAGKAEFGAEIEKAGFEFVRDVKIKGLEENYFVEFQKPARQGSKGR